MANLIPHLVIWAVVTTVVIFLAIYRRKVDLKADDMLHVLDEEVKLGDQQVAIAKKIEHIDRWGKILTVIAALYGVGIAGWYIYTLFMDTSVKMN